MFKTRRAGLRRCKESQQTAERGGCKRRKLEGISNITSKRVTIPPGFLCLGVKSETIRRSPRIEKKNFDSHTACILSEDLHGLFKDNSNEKNHKPSKLSKSESTQTSYNTTASEYFLNSLRSQNRHQPPKEQPKETPHRRKTLVRNNSKSLFREINERCAKIQTSNPTNFDYPVIPILDANCKEERFRPTCFCLKLTRDISIDVDQQDYLFNSKLSIRDKIRDTNLRLRGEMNTPTTGTKRKHRGDPENDPKGIENFQYIPRCDWIFHTPPRQRMSFPRAEGCAIQPAVICTTRKRSNIYELNPDVNVDLSEYSNRQNVPVDSEYLRPLASFVDKMDTSFNVDNLGAASQGCAPDEENYGFYEKRFKFSNPSSTLSHPFSEVTLRPVKTVKKMSRVNNFFRHKSEEECETTPTGPNTFHSKKQSENDVTVVEKDGRYELVDKRLSEQEEPFSFNFRKNLFAGQDDDKFFDFDADDVFDFEME